MGADRAVLQIEVHLRVPLEDVGIGREVPDDIRARHRLRKVGQREDVAFDQPEPGMVQVRLQVATPPGPEVVVRHDDVPLSQQPFHQVAADEPGASCDEVPLRSGGHREEDDDPVTRRIV